MFPLHGQDPFYRIVRYTLTSILRFKSSLILGLSKSFTSHHPHSPSPLPTLPTYLRIHSYSNTHRPASQSSKCQRSSLTKGGIPADPPPPAKLARLPCRACLAYPVAMSTSSSVAVENGSTSGSSSDGPNKYVSPLCESLLAHPQATSVRMYSTVLTWMLVRLQQYRSKLYAVAPLRLS